MRKIALALVLVLAGCQHDLQRPYVDAMIATEKVLRDDIKAGDYKPAAASLAVIDGMTKANKNADAALKAAAKKGK